MLKERIIGGAIVFVVAVAFLALGGIPLWLGLMVLSCAGIYELYSVSGCIGVRWMLLAFPLTVALFLFLRENVILYGMILFAMVYFGMLLLNFQKMQLNRPLLFLLALCWIGAMSLSIYYYRTAEDGIYRAAILLASSWGADTCAYFTGRSLGKRHPFPVLSPKKSVEGCIGGIIGAMLLCALLGYLFHTNIRRSMALGLVGSVFAEIGDLAASAIKRKYGAKDYSHLILGHGGVLDRVDSMLFTGAAIYLCINLLRF